MKITNSEVIKNGEQELIDGITADLDWGAIEDIFREQHHLGIEEDIAYKRGDIVVHNQQIAYKLDFEVKVTVSVLLDREGSYISVNISGDHENSSENDEVGLPEETSEETLQSVPRLDDVLAKGEDDFEVPGEEKPAFEDEDPGASIAQMASRAGEIIEEME